jgi:signal transduction histidine kinase/ActR/RegA family two-component response regulator
LRGTLFSKYAVYFTGLVSIALLASALVGLYFSYHESRVLIEELQREKVRAVALRIEQFARLIETQLRAPLLLRQVGASASPNELSLELIRLLRQAPAVIDVAWVDGAGVQQVKVSRIGRDAIGPAESWVDNAAFIAARTGALYVGPIYFRAESEPYSVFAVGDASADGGVLIADVNLKFVWEVVSTIKVGIAGYAYVVDSEGRLISHPQIGLVLRQTDLRNLPQVHAALARTSSADRNITIATASANGSDQATLTARASIPLLGWHVLVEQPLAEAFEPLYDAAVRTVVLLILGLALAVAAALALARRMSAPIQALKERATRIGEGHLDEQVDIDTGDELQALAEQFNQMAQRLLESYTGLEKKIAERTSQLAAANAAKSRFLAVASHDLRQPMHALGLFVAQLKEASSAGERERLLQKVEASSDAAAQLLDSLLDLSKLDAGTVTADPAVFEVQLLLNRLEHDYSVIAQAKDLRLRVRPSSLRVETDPLLLERILSNLLANAVRHTSEGGVLLACRRRATKARFEVWDTGPGIARAELGRIFDEFYQVRSRLPERAGGLGMGLAIVKRIAQLLEIDVQVHSIEGRGSLFAIDVPLAPIGLPTGAEKETPVFEPMRFDGALALVIDDDGDARESLAGLLTQWGWRVIAVESGDLALRALGDEPQLDVVITDYRLAADEVGTQVIERVRKACGAGVPAIVVTGDAIDDLRESMHSPGVQVLRKPLQAAKLRSLLHHLRAQDEGGRPARSG